MIYLIGLGLNPPDSITQEGSDAIKASTEVYLETYTSILPCSKEELEKAINKQIKEAPREQMEQQIEQLMQKENIAILVMGDPLAATTHNELLKKVKIIHNTSIFTAIAKTGLSLYKFGKTTSIPFPQKGTQISSPMQTIKENKEAHTLCLLDINPQTKTTMTTKEAIQILKDMQESIITKTTRIIIAASIGTKEEKIIYGACQEVEKITLTTYPQCIVIVGNLNFKEEETTETFKQQ